MNFLRHQYYLNDNACPWPCKLLLWPTMCSKAFQEPSSKTTDMWTAGCTLVHLWEQCVLFSWCKDYLQSSLCSPYKTEPPRREKQLHKQSLLMAAGGSQGQGKRDGLSLGDAACTPRKKARIHQRGAKAPGIQEACGRRTVGARSWLKKDINKQGKARYGILEVKSRTFHMWLYWSGNHFWGEEGQEAFWQRGGR